MYCSKCGKKIGEQEKFCSYCGAKNERLVEKATLTSEVIQKVKEGDESAFDIIYHQTYQTIWQITRSFFPEDKTECDDCIQDIYLNLYEKISYFDPEKGEFLPWLKRMAQNVCVNHYNKKKKINVRNTSLDAVTETEDSEKEKQFEDERLEFNPEAVMDKNETSRLLQEILDELPLEQKQCLLLYYAAQYKQEVIAEMLGIPKGTVKSRLYNGKKLVEEKVLALEKRGTKLYSMSPIAFFIWLFVKDSEAQAANAAFAGISALQAATESIGSAAVESSAAITESAVTSVEVQAATVAENAATSAVVKVAVGAGAKAAATKAVATKVIAGIVGAAVIGTGGYFAYEHYENNKVEDSISSKVEELESETETDTTMKVKESLKDIVDQEFLTHMLTYLPEFTDTVPLSNVSHALFSTAGKQYIVLQEGVNRLDYYCLPDEYVIGIDKTDLVTDLSVAILYKKEAFQSIFDLLNSKYTWEELKESSGMISYLDEKSVGFTGAGIGGAETTIEINKIEENAEYLNVHYKKDTAYGPSIETNYYIARIVSENNSIGYRIDSIAKDIQADMAAEYADLITAYSKYFYDGEETPDLLTEEIITGRQYGIGKADAEPDTKLYYGVVDSNNDGAYECIFTSEPSEDPEKIYLYDFWMKKDRRFLNVLSGFNPEYMAFFDDGMIKTFRSDGENSGIYDSMRVDQERGLREMRVLYEYDEEHPYDEDEFNEKVNMTAAVDKNIQWTLIEPES